MAISRKLKSICDDFGLTPDGVRYALEQYQRVVTELTGGRFSKLTYDAALIIDEVEACRADLCGECDMQARLMTLEEAQGADYCWFESYMTGVAQPASVQISAELWHGKHTSDIEFCGWSTHFVLDEEYGKAWRCWTTRPTDEQREAAKWNADENHRGGF